MSDSYPHAPAARDAWILARRPSRNRVTPEAPYAAFVETEPAARGGTEDVLAIFLSNRECPLRCLFCDLWKNTLEESVSPEAIVRQVADTLARFPPPPVVKLYNAGSFFDPAAIPPAALPAVARLVADRARVIVESHPAFVGESMRRFASAIGGRLEVAIGLETIHPDVFEKLAKRTTLDALERACARVVESGIDLRAFVLVGLPWLSRGESVEWAVRSAQWAFGHGAGLVSLIPTRAGNGALDALAAEGAFFEPSLGDLERAFDAALALGGGRVLVDSWELRRFARCPRCADARIARLVAQGLVQRRLPAITCDDCGESSGSSVRDRPAQAKAFSLP